MPIQGNVLPKRSPVAIIISLILAVGLVGGIIFIATTANRNENIKNENVIDAEKTASHVAQIATIYHDGNKGNGKYPEELDQMNTIIPDYHTVTYTNDDNKGFCVIVQDVENKIKVSYDSEAGGLNKTGKACKP
jgi:hypothetical protein